MVSQGIENSQNTLEKEQSWKMHTLWFQTLLQSYSDLNCGAAYRQDIWARTESPEMNPHKFGQMISNKGARTIQWGKDSLQQMVLRKLDIHM